MSANTFFQRAGDVYGHQRPIAFVGQCLSDAGQSGRLTLINKNPQAKQVTTMVVDTYTNGATYAFSVVAAGSTTAFSYVATTADADTSGVASSIVSQFNNTPGLRGQVIASSSSATITFTGQYPGISFTISESDAKLATPSTTTSAASADTVAFGRAMISSAYSSNSANKLGHVPTVADFTAQVMTITVATGAGASFTGVVEINGKKYIANAVVHDTDATTTATAIAAAINAVMPTETVIASTSTADVILTAEVEGAEFEAYIDASGSASADVTRVYTTGPSISTSLAKVLAGLSERSEMIENLTRGGDDPAYPANHGVQVVSRGLMAVTNSQSIAYGDEVYVSLASATKGLLYNSADTDRVWIPPALLRWERSEPSSQSNNIRIVAVNAGNGRVF